MKTIRLIPIIFLMSCAIYKKADLSLISIGMSKQQVIQTLGKKPDNLIGAKQYPEGTLEVLQYTEADLWSGMEQRYWLYFWNNNLAQWGRPGDWQQEADKIYELRIR